MDNFGVGRADGMKCRGHSRMTRKHRTADVGMHRCIPYRGNVVHIGVFGIMCKADR